MYKKLIIPSVLLLAACSTTETTQTDQTFPSNNGPNDFSNNLLITDESVIMQEDAQLTELELREKYVDENFKTASNINSDFGEIDRLAEENRINKEEMLAMNNVSDLNGSMLLDKSEFRQRYTLNIDTDTSFKQKISTFANQNGFRVVWDSDYDVYYENNVTYTDSDVIGILKSIADDLNSMALDIHMNIYMKNKVVLVYSVRN